MVIVFNDVTSKSCEQKLITKEHIAAHENFDCFVIPNYHARVKHNHSLGAGTHTHISRAKVILRTQGFKFLNLILCLEFHDIYVG